jgi:hypothetical protein
MPVSMKQLQDIFENSLTEFFENEFQGILDGVSERNSCGRLAIYMQAAVAASGLRGYWADTEYNRKQGGQVKSILDHEMRVIDITSDLILHGRGAVVGEDNLIAIEMKKAQAPRREKDADRARLRAMTKVSYDGVWSNDGTTHPEHVCGYKLGVYIELNNRTRRARVEYYMSGEKTVSSLRRY